MEMHDYSKVDSSEILYEEPDGGFKTTPDDGNNAGEQSSSACAKTSEYERVGSNDVERRQPTHIYTNYTNDADQSVSPAEVKRSAFKCSKLLCLTITVVLLLIAFASTASYVTYLTLRVYALEETVTERQSDQYQGMVNESINEEVASLIQNLTEYRTHMDDKFVNLTRVVGRNEQAIAAAISDVEQNERDISDVSSGLSSARTSIRSNGGSISSLNSQLQEQIPLIASNAQCPCWSSTSPCRADSIENNIIKNCKSGYIVSPNYPSNYGNNADYQWDVENPGYGNLKITFLHYEVETRSGQNGQCNRPFDYLQVITRYTCTASSGYTSLHTVNGMSTIPMKFISDGSTTKKGFKLKFEFS